MNYFIAWMIGSLAGLHISTWGMYKDAPHEGFTWRKYFRSTIVGGVLGLAAISIVGWDLMNPAAMFMYWGICYALERAATEFWKYFIREEDQSKYFIPMQFGVMGKPMKDARKRIPIGIAIGIIVVLVFLGIDALDRAELGWSRWLVVITLGSIGGWISAFGGAWKDAPVEGFETFKFFRSPGIAAAWAGMMSQFTSSYLAMSVGAIGFTVATIETWKSFYHADKPRGKFAGMPITHPEMLERRKRFGIVYAAIWVAVLSALTMALMRSPGAPWPKGMPASAADVAMSDEATVTGNGAGAQIDTVSATVSAGDQLAAESGAESGPESADEASDGLDLAKDLGAHAGTYAVSLVGGLVPVVNVEIYLAALAAGSWTFFDLLILAMLAALGQMTAKLVLYYAAQGAVSLPGQRLQTALATAQTRVTTWNDKALGVYFTSSLLGLPPFYLVSLAAGILKIGLVSFLGLGILGRFVRFIAVLAGASALW